MGSKTHLMKEAQRLVGKVQKWIHPVQRVILILTRCGKSESSIDDKTFLDRRT